MKKLIYITLIITVAAFAAPAQNKNLRGDEAINQLKQDGQYHSLMDAVRAARQQNGQTDEPQPDDAIGQTTTLTIADGAVSDRFGYSVAISGETAIVGAYLDDVGANVNQGSAYVFIRTGTIWTQQAQLNAADGAANDEFGVSVAISGETAIVSAWKDDVGANVNQGSAYVFVRAGTNWTHQSQLLATDGAAGDFFGVSVAISGETAIIGADFDDVGANIEQGSAYVFLRAGTVWTQQAQLFATGGAAGDQFGYSVAINGETAIVGAPRDDVDRNANQGSAYVFVRAGTNWAQQAQLRAASSVANDEFGVSVAISDNTTIVGAWTYDVGVNVNQGSAYVFIRTGTIWTQQSQFRATGGAAGDLFGYSVAISGETAIVGAWSDDVGLNNDQGSAYVFVRSGTIWTQQAQLLATGGAAGDEFGKSVAISGDKIIIGAPLSDVSVSNPLAPQAVDQGEAFMFINSFAPTSANVSLGGRVLTADGAGVRNATVYLTLTDGETRSVQTGSFGFYRFADIAVGQTVVIGVNSKHFTFAPQIISVNEELSEVNFTAQE